MNSFSKISKNFRNINYLAKFLDTLAKSFFSYKNSTTGKLTYPRRRFN